MDKYGVEFDEKKITGAERTKTSSPAGAPPTYECPMCHGELTELQYLSRHCPKDGTKPFEQQGV